MRIINLLKAALMTPSGPDKWGLPICLIGDPGIGKTTMIREHVAKPLGLCMETILISIREPADMSGIPIPDKTGNFVNLAAPGWAKRVMDTDGALVMWDELNGGNGAQQNSALRVINENVVGELEMGGHVRHLCAMNPEDIAAGGNTIAPPLANRMGWIDLSAPDVREWVEWLTSTEPDAGYTGTVDDLQKEEARILKAWPQAFSKARGLVAGFITARPAALHKLPKANDPNASRAWPSPRSWEMATRALASSMVHGLDEDTMWEFVTAFVGEGVGHEFVSWHNTADLPDPEDVLDGKVKFEANPRRLDITNAVLSACTMLVTPANAPKRMERAQKLYEIMKPIVKSQPDLCIIPTRNLVQARLAQISDDAIDVMAEMQPVLQLAKSHR